MAVMSWYQWSHNLLTKVDKGRRLQISTTTGAVGMVSGRFPERRLPDTFPWQDVSWHDMIQ